jgi:hypothetical protein
VAKIPKRVLGVVGLLLLCGCSLSSMYVTADRATYEAIAPEYQSYIDEDVGLTADQKARRVATLAAWHARIAEAEGQGDE